MERKWLINIRNNINLTQSSIAYGIGISQQYYSKIENGTRTPSISLAKKIAIILNFEWTKFYE